ncbi:MAG: gfo/Idh/MocA family oxidoreductase [Phycisphaera sp.]|nr:gfo/Idh/MocA family oxidoreductase [Phycisphaera sp.]
MSDRLTRRSFIASISTAGLTLPLVMPRLVRGASPNEIVRHAGFGANGMSWADMSSFSRNKNWKLVAVCDVDRSRFDKVDKAFPDAKKYADYRELLDKEGKNIDSVNVSTPDHMHAKIGLAAMSLGKNVYGQKPLAQNLFEIRQLQNMAAKSGVVTQMGIQIHSSVQYRLAVRLIQDGAIGKVSYVYTFSNKKWGDPTPRPNTSDPVPDNLNWDLWLGVATERPFIGGGYYHPGTWRKRLDFGTGTFGDMGCHIYDPVFNSLGVTAPISVTSHSPKPNEYNWGINANIDYVFPGSQYTTDPVRVTWYDGDARPPKEIQDKVLAELQKEYDQRGIKDKKPSIPGQGSIFIGEKGMMLLPHIGAPKLLPVDQYKDYDYPKLPGRDHWGSFVDAIRGEDKTTAHFGYAGPLTESVIIGGVAVRFPETELKWDSKALRFTNNDDANKYVKREYRKGQEIEAVV